MKKVKLTLTIKIPSEQLTEQERHEVFEGGMNAFRNTLKAEAAHMGREIETELHVEEVEE